MKQQLTLLCLVAATMLVTASAFPSVEEAKHHYVSSVLQVQHSSTQMMKEALNHPMVSDKPWFVNMLKHIVWFFPILLCWLFGAAEVFFGGTVVLFGTCMRNTLFIDLKLEY
jgi:hypothetical protein